VPPLPPDALRALLAVRLDRGSLDDVLGDLVGIAKEALPGADEVSTTLVRHDKPWTAAHTGQLALDADEMQYERGYGPCIDAGLTGTVLVVEDNRRETRWPDYTAHVAERGVLSSMSVPLPLQIDTVGALNCYSRTPGAFTDADVEVALEVAEHLAMAVANAVLHADAVRLGEDMRAAMATRAVIEQAKGIVMAQNRCDADAAFAVLTRASQGRNIKLRDLARDIVAGVSSPPPAPPGR
jgi:GAF domain-containing protein